MADFSDGETIVAHINVGLLIAHTPAANLDRLRDFARPIVDDSRTELVGATGCEWGFHSEVPTRHTAREPRRPSDFLDEASLRMVVEGPFDMLIVLTDAALYTRKHAVVAGLASPVSRVAVVFGTLSVLSATLYSTGVRNLFYPRVLPAQGEARRHATHGCGQRGHLPDDSSGDRRSLCDGRSAHALHRVLRLPAAPHCDAADFGDPRNRLARQGSTRRLHKHDRRSDGRARRNWRAAPSERHLALILDEP